MRLEFASDDGMSLIELAVVSAIFMAVLAMLAAVLNSATKTTNVISQESEALDQARVAVARFEREVRSALDFSICNGTANDNCILMFTQLGNAQTQLVKYQVAVTTGTKGQLLRSVCTAASSCDPAQAALTNLEIVSGSTAFACLVDAQVVRVRIALKLTPLSTTSNSGLLSFNSTARPRNLARATC